MQSDKSVRIVQTPIRRVGITWPAWRITRRGVGLGVILAIAWGGGACRPWVETTLERNAANPAPSSTPAPALTLAPLADYPSLAAAIADYEAYNEANPDDVAGYIQLSEAYVQQHRYLDAVTLLTTARRLAPDNPDVIFQLAMVYKRQRNFNDAITAFNRVLQLDEQYPNAQAQLTDTLLKLQRRDRAEE